MLNTQQQKIISIPTNKSYNTTPISTNTTTSTHSQTNINVSLIDTNCKIKKVGTREMVYKGLALRTSGNLTKDDIEYKIINGKEWYISKKMSERMRELIKKNAFSRRKKTHVNINTNNTSVNIIPSVNNTSINNTIVNNKNIISPSNIISTVNQSCKTVKNIKFAPEKNNIQEVFYNELSDYDIAELRAEAELEDTMSAPKPFIVESVNDIDLDQQLLKL